LNCRASASGVSAGQQFARYPEALHVHGMRDPVTRLGVPETETPAGRAQEEMVVLVLTVGLEQVVVYVLHSRGPDDLPVFCAKIVKEFAQSAHRAAASGTGG
jgi:hypothetical protein